MVYSILFRSQTLLKPHPIPTPSGAFGAHGNADMLHGRGASATSAASDQVRIIFARVALAKRRLPGIVPRWPLIAIIALMLRFRYQCWGSALSWVHDGLRSSREMRARRHCRCARIVFSPTGSKIGTERLANIAAASAVLDHASQRCQGGTDLHSFASTIGRAQLSTHARLTHTSHFPG